MCEGFLSSSIALATFEREVISNFGVACVVVALSWVATLVASEKEDMHLGIGLEWRAWVWGIDR